MARPWQEVCDYALIIDELAREEAARNRAPSV
jgi:hypothetical protein